MKKLLFMLLCCCFFVIGCNNVSEEDFNEFDFDELNEIDNDGISEKEINIVKEIDDLIFKNDFNKAKELCEKLIKDSDDKSYYAYAHRGRIYLSEKKYEEAIEDYKKAIELSKDKSEDWFFMNLAKAEQDAGNYDDKEILSYFDKAAEKGTSNSFIYEGRARIKLVLGDIEGAKEDLKKALSLVKNDAAAEKNIKRQLEQIESK